MPRGATTSNFIMDQVSANVGHPVAGVLLAALPPLPERACLDGALTAAMARTETVSFRGLVHAAAAHPDRSWWAPFSS